MTQSIISPSTRISCTLHNYLIYFLSINTSRMFQYFIHEKDVKKISRDGSRGMAQTPTHGKKLLVAKRLGPHQTCRSLVLYDRPVTPTHFLLRLWARIFYFCHPFLLITHLYACNLTKEQNN